MPSVPASRYYTMQSPDDPSVVYRVRRIEFVPPPSSRFSVLRLRDVITNRRMGEDDVEFGLGHIEPSLLNPFSVAFWNWLALKVAAKILVKLVDPRAVAASLDQQLQEGARSGVRRLSDGRYEIRVNDQGLDFVDLRHGLSLHIEARTEPRRSAERESGRAA